MNKIEEIEDALRIVGPLAAMIGLTKEDTRILLNYVDEMYNRGITGRDAGLLLRQYLKDYKNV